MNPLDVLLRLVAAALCGGLIGWNREREDKPAGLRTHMLVSIGAAAFTLVMIGMLAPGDTGDVSRIVQGVATGVGFLGAGSILQSERGVRGMTTAAGIWVMAAIGVACGAGSYVIASITTLLTFIVLSLVVKLEHRVGIQKPEGQEPGARSQEPEVRSQEPGAGTG